MEEYNFLF